MVSLVPGILQLMVGYSARHHKYPYQNPNCTSLVLIKVFLELIMIYDAIELFCFSTIIVISDQSDCTIHSVAMVTDDSKNKPIHV